MTNGHRFGRTPIVTGVLRVVALVALSVSATVSVAALHAGAAAAATQPATARAAAHSPAPAVRLLATTDAHHHSPPGKKQGALAVALSTIGLLALVIGTILVVSRRRRPVGRMPQGIFPRTSGTEPPGTDGAK